MKHHPGLCHTEFRSHTDQLRNNLYIQINSTKFRNTWWDLSSKHLMRLPACQPFKSRIEGSAEPLTFLVSSFLFGRRNPIQQDNTPLLKKPDLWLSDYEKTSWTNPSLSPSRYHFHPKSTFGKFRNWYSTRTPISTHKAKALHHICHIWLLQVSAIYRETQ